MGKRCIETRRAAGRTYPRPRVPPGVPADPDPETLHETSLRSRRLPRARPPAPVAPLGPGPGTVPGEPARAPGGPGLHPGGRLRCGTCDAREAHRQRARQRARLGAPRLRAAQPPGLPGGGGGVREGRAAAATGRWHAPAGRDGTSAGGRSGPRLRVAGACEGRRHGRDRGRSRSRRRGPPPGCALRLALPERSRLRRSLRRAGPDHPGVAWGARGRPVRMDRPRHR